MFAFFSNFSTPPKKKLQQNIADLMKLKFENWEICKPNAWPNNPNHFTIAFRHTSYEVPSLHIFFGIFPLNGIYFFHFVIWLWAPLKIIGYYFSTSLSFGSSSLPANWIVSRVKKKIPWTATMPANAGSRSSSRKWSNWSDSSINMLGMFNDCRLPTFD